MGIPDFQTLMLPLLQPVGDGKEHSNREVLDALADQFILTDEERKELLPSGQEFTFRNRVAWARTHLKGAGPDHSISEERFITFGISELVPYSLVFCHKKQEIFSASWRLCARNVFGCGYPR
jgi:hypothetical protein